MDDRCWRLGGGKWHVLQRLFVNALIRINESHCMRAQQLVERAFDELTAYIAIWSAEMRERAKEYGLAADHGPAAVTCFLRDYDLWWDMTEEEQDMVIRLWIACQDAKDVKEETGDRSLV